MKIEPAAPVTNNGLAPPPVVEEGLATVPTLVVEEGLATVPTQAADNCSETAPVTDTGSAPPDQGSEPIVGCDDEVIEGVMERLMNCYKRYGGVLLRGPSGNGQEEFVTALVKRLASGGAVAKPHVVLPGVVLAAVDGKLDKTKSAVEKEIFADQKEKRRTVADLTGTLPTLPIVIKDIDALFPETGMKKDGVQWTLLTHFLELFADAKMRCVIIAICGDDDAHQRLLTAERRLLPLQFSLPGTLQRERLLDYLAPESFKQWREADRHRLVSLTENYTGVEIACLVDDARLALSAKNDGDAATPPLHISHFERASEMLEPIYRTNRQLQARMKAAKVWAWSPALETLLKQCDELLAAVRAGNTGDNADVILIVGPPRSGRTALALHLARESGAPLVFAVAAHADEKEVDEEKAAFKAAQISLSTTIVLHCSGYDYPKKVVNRIMGHVQMQPEGHRLLVVMTLETHDSEVHHHDYLKSLPSLICHLPAITSHQQLYRIIAGSGQLSEPQSALAEEMFNVRHSSSRFWRLKDVVKQVYIWRATALNETDDRKAVNLLFEGIKTRAISKKDHHYG